MFTNFACVNYRKYGSPTQNVVTLLPNIRVTITLTHMSTSYLSAHQPMYHFSCFCLCVRRIPYTGPTFSIIPWSVSCLTGSAKKTSFLAYYFSLHATWPENSIRLSSRIIFLVGKPKRKRPLRRPRRRWVDNIRTDLQEVGCGYMDWFGLAQDRDRWPTLVSAVMNFRVPWNAGNFLTSCKQLASQEGLCTMELVSK